MSSEGTTQPNDQSSPPSSKASTEKDASREDGARRKSSSKSRNGCVTCKARRIKCDETKPGCNQCARRRMTCGGYRKDIRFQPIEKPLAARPTQKRPTQKRMRVPTPQTNDDRAASSTWSYLELPEDWDHAPSGVDGSARPALGCWTQVEAFDLSFPDTAFGLPGNIGSDFNLDTLDDGSIRPDSSAGILGIRSLDPDGSENANDVDFASFILCSPLGSVDLPTSTLWETLDPDIDSSEEVASLFHQHTRHILCIYEDVDQNPWSTLIWPMVKDSQALYHAIAAMTCLHLSKSKPSMREKGLMHVQKSTQALEADLNSGKIHMEAALATTIALGFAKSWDYQKVSTGRDHIKGARILLQQFLSNYDFPLSSADKSARLRFLANTWVYMDVIARLTSDCGAPPNSELLSLFGTQELSSPEDELDPLMGYAASLFPIIGRVADLVNQIRTRNAKRNSPAIIARAIELRKAIQTWTPAFDLESVDNPTSNMSDAIQTAEAYRWATFLLLQQAVPELPNLRSVEELGQKILIYLATISITSQTTIIHTYPLMVAGTETIDEEDREFVRERWNIMSKRMITGIVDRCLQITEEVWRRRDAYLIDRTSLYAPGLVFAETSPPRSRTEQSSVGNGSVDLNPANTTEHRESPQRALAARKSPVPADFPISAAFKKGVDWLTRSGDIEWTVKGRLHWIGVMKDWGWEVMLG